jgi:hypothetical protein
MSKGVPGGIFGVSAQTSPVIGYCRLIGRHAKTPVRVVVPSDGGRFTESASP